MTRSGSGRLAVVLCASLLSPVALGGADVTDERLLAESSHGRNWLRKSGNAQAQHYSALDSINDSNVNKLGVAWISALPVSDGIAGTPIVVDGVIYLGVAYSRVFALDSGTGSILWSFDPDVRSALGGDSTLSWVARANRGVAAGDGKVFVATADCRLIALDADNGEVTWSRTTCDTSFGYAISDSPYYGGGKVFVGNAGSESGKKNRGYVTAYDSRTGDLLWRFYTVPSADAAENTSPAMKMAAATWSGDALETYGGGGSNWNEMTYDPDTELLYFGTAGALPYVHEIRNPDGGDSLFTSSVLAVNANTGEYVWHYQTVPQDSWEYNATMNITLADLVFEGRTRATLLIAPKNGFQYVLDRKTGELLAADKYAKVTWASGVNLETGRPVTDPQAEYWRREAGSKVQVWPNMWGAHSWNPMAFSPQTGLLYIPVIDIPSEVTYEGNGEFSDTLVMVTELDGKPFHPGKLVAYDPVSQQACWTVTHELPFNGGVLATAGNLVFQGDAFGKFSAYQASSGKELWAMSTGSTISAAPASYLQDDVQYILLPAGAGGGLQYAYPALHAVDKAQGPTRLIAFRLDGDGEVAMPALTVRELPGQPALDATAEEIESGRELFGTYCASCHGKEAVGRYGGSVPDLRYANTEAHASWHAIVVGGSRQQTGMPKQNLSIDQSEAIRSYILSLSQQLRTSDQTTGSDLNNLLN
jgi:quinohemoprotein ethanol dehydrogenase